jgi:2'-5' RNA ligase
MRLFIALNLPKRERTRVHKAAGTLRDEGLPVRWIDPERLHVTLKFLGKVRSDRVPDIERVMERVADATPKFEMELGGFGAFPTIRKPRVIWLGIDASPELRCLKQDLEWGLGDCGFDPETRAFHPHITLGRADEAGGAGAFRGLDERMAEMDFRGTVSVRSIDLMESRLSREGARYTVVSKATLASS